MSKEKLLKIWKVTKTIIIPLTIALADVLFWAKAMTDPTWLILYPRHIALGFYESFGLKKLDAPVADLTVDFNEDLTADEISDEEGY